MRIQDYIVEQTQAKAVEAFRYIEAVPEDRVDWKPLESGRSVLDQARELAKCPDWAFSILSNEPMPDWSDESQAATRAELEAWKTVAECKAQCFAKLQRLLKLFAEISDERLAETKWLPYEGGRDYTVLEMMDYPRWNFNYHLGQVAYVQLLYGDKEMH